MYKEIEKLMSRLDSAGIQVARNSHIAKDGFDAFHLFYDSVYPTINNLDERLAFARAQAGLGDIATKINMASHTDQFSTLLPHLKNMTRGSVRQNVPNPSIDSAASKTTELYLACLAINAGYTNVELDDPENSSRGENPDLLFVRDGERWAIAVKTSYGDSDQTLFEGIKKGANQIARAGCQGIVIVNVKNRLPLTRASAPAAQFSSAAHAISTLQNQIRDIRDRMMSVIVKEDWLGIFSNGPALPLILFMGHGLARTSVVRRRWLIFPSLSEYYVPVRSFIVGLVPPAPPTLESQTGRLAIAAQLSSELNVQLQRNPPS